MFRRAAQALFLIAFALVWAALANAASISFIEQAVGSTTVVTSPDLTGISSERLASPKIAGTDAAPLESRAQIAQGV